MRFCLATGFPLVLLLTLVTGGGCNAAPPGGASTGATGATNNSTGSTGGTASGSGTGGSGATTASAGGMSSTGANDPIVAPDDQWTWVDFPSAVCASGTPTGLAVNPHAGSPDLLIYLEGGGFCTDATNCWGSDAGATNLRGYDATTFAANPPAYPALKRTASGNPFAQMNMVYVPYCTGDLHSGSTIANLTLPDGGPQATYFYGARDMEIFLARLVPTFAQQTRVWLLGTSAGGFGTFLNFGRVASAFRVGVDLIDDSGPPLVVKGKTDNSGLFATWGSPLPTDCAGCASLEAVLDYDLQIQQTFSPAGELAFLSFEEDTVISKDFGYTLAEYPAVLATFSAGLPASPAAATFLVSNYPAHVIESDPALASVYFPWMSQMVNRDLAWADATYDGGL